MLQTVSLTQTLRLLGWTRSKFHSRRRKGKLPFQPLARCRWQRYEFALADVEGYLGHPVDIDAIESDGVVPVIDGAESDPLAEEGEPIATSA